MICLRSKCVVHIDTEGEDPVEQLAWTTHSRRNYMFHYSGENLGAVRYKDIKALITGPGHGGLPGLAMYNVMRDPIEREGGLYSYLWTITPLQNIVKGHMRLIEKYPHRVSETMPKGAELTPHD